MNAGQLTTAEGMWEGKAALGTADVGRGVPRAESCRDGNAQTYILGV